MQYLNRLVEGDVYLPGHASLISKHTESNIRRQFNANKEQKVWIERHEYRKRVTQGYKLPYLANHKVDSCYTKVEGISDLI